MTTSIAKINKALFILYYDCRLIKNKNYFYVVGKDVELAKSQSIFVCKVDQLINEQWIENIKQIIEE